jgi:hypothetical protein
VNLAVQLLHLGAPDELVDQALTAAEEELAHARTCLELARKADASALEPTLPSNWSRRPLEGEAGFERLAVEAWLDGIVNEGASALMSQGGLSTLGEKGARPALLQLVREEWGHFGLAQDILRFAVSKSDRARAAVEGLGEQAPRPRMFEPLEEVEGFAPAEQAEQLAVAHGRLMHSAWRAAGLG